MKRQDGRCTAAHESKAFPYFTFNSHWSDKERNDLRVERHALLYRMRFVTKYRGLLSLLDVEVDDTGGFHTDRQVAIDLLMVILRGEYGIQRASWVKHEAL